MKPIDPRTGRIVLGVVFVALLATPALMRRAAPAGSVDAIARFGFTLTEQARQAGLVHMHEAPELDPQLRHIMPQVASMGASVSVVDFDRDGLDDIYVTTSSRGGQNRLFRNLGDGQFTDVAPQVGLADLNAADRGASMGAVWGDIDNDGFEDVLVYRWGRQDLYRNLGGTRFESITDRSPWPAYANVNTALWLDVDRDGLLDAFLAGYFDERVNLWDLASTRIMPESFEYAQNGGRKYLYRNRGDGRFEEVSASLGLVSRRWALAAVAADFRGVGATDIVIANDYGVSEYFRYDNGRFTEVGRSAGIGRAPKSGMNASIGDVLNRGAFSIYVSNISEDGILLQGNNLWMPSGADRSAGEFENMATAMTVDHGGWSFGAQFGDLNNDGWQDLFLVNGFVSANRDRSYWYDYSKVAGGHEVVIGDARHWPDMDGRSLAGYQQSRVWVNSGRGGFVEAASSVGVTDQLDGRAVALGDFRNRGMLDVLVANQRGPLLFYANDVAGDNAWIAFTLEGACRTAPVSEPCTNRSAIGAQVTVRWRQGAQVQEVSGGAGFASQYSRRLHFGLGAGTPQVDEVEVRWPSGRTTTLRNLPTMQTHALKEGT